jgi:hypothetical protein
MDFVSSINHEVLDVKATSQLLCDHFDFAQSYVSTNSITVTNGILIIQLHQSNSDRKVILCLDYQSDDLETASKKLLNIGFDQKGVVEKKTSFRHQILFTGELGINILLYKLFTEDDLGINIDLPLSLNWEPNAISIVQLLLKEVPLNFRAQARKKAVERAESITIAKGDLQVSFNIAMQSFMDITPKNKHSSLFKRLQEMDVDISIIEREDQ